MYICIVCVSNLPLYSNIGHAGIDIRKTDCNNKSKVGLGFGKAIQDFDGAARQHCGFEGPFWCQQKFDVPWSHVFAEPHVCFGGLALISPRKDETTKLQDHFRQVEAEQATESRPLAKKSGLTCLTSKICRYCLGRPRCSKAVMEQNKLKKLLP